METATFDRPRLLPLDLMRGGAALLVAVGHSQWIGSIDIGETFALCVPFFLMLSGYVLSHAYGENISNGRLNVGRFAVLRLARLYPLHIVTAAAVLAFWLSIELARKFVGLPIAPIVGLHATSAEWLETITLTHFLFGGGVSFNTPSWSISVEFWGGFYLFALWVARTPVLQIALLLFGLAAFLFVIVSGGLFAYQGQWIHPAAEKTYAIGIGCFAVGWILYRWSDRIEPFVRKVPLIGWWTLAALIAVAIVVPPVQPAANRIAEAAYYVAFALLIAGLARSSVLFGEKFMERAGDWSYGIYLWHIPLALVFRASTIIAERVTGIPILNTLLVDIIYIPTLIIISAISYKYIEVPTKLWLRGVGYRSTSASIP